MQDVQVDSDGAFRCWNCGGKNLSAKRTRRAKVTGTAAGAAGVLVTGGVGAVAALGGTLATKKKLYCQACGAYNKMGNAQPFVVKPEQSAVDTSPKALSALSEFVGMTIITVVVFTATFLAVAYQAWWWLIILGPACIFVAIGLAGFAVEAVSKARGPRPAKQRRAKPPKNVQMGAAGPAFEVKKDRPRQH
ncbi:hypothetical protein SEA_ENALISNAILO_17 [Gordonia phage EnalisNailo]|nr:hypothetical protein SEA_LILAS_17 [Gordonia phage Lilas]QAY17544.1 hypothetical protein SEA_BRADISSA_17 [Gordonia phage Bradissa]QDB74369.1 hypothetical protein SEA_ENALISNAILO_17 [Gordonia phage EnalisNailo]